MLSKHIVVLLAATGLSQAASLPAKRAAICGVKGYDRGNDNYYYDGSGKENTYAACSALCAQSTKCQSFGYGAKECMLFSIALNGNFDADSQSTDVYYDRSCAASPTTAATATKSSSSPAIKVSTASPSSKTTTKTTTRSSTKATTTTSSLRQTSPVTTSSMKSSSTTSVAAACTSAISMTTFTWFNSTHNLDCVNPNYPSDATVCWNETAVYPSGTPDTSCTPYCYTGLASVAYQPIGYGPVDSIDIGFSDGQVCAETSPKGFRDTELGSGSYDCGSAAQIIGFTGDSNYANGTGPMATVSYNPYGATCGGVAVQYSASFSLNCVHDQGGNATCTTNLPVTLHMISTSA